MASIGVNYLKFPPGFFGDDPFKVMDGRASRKRSKDKAGSEEGGDLEMSGTKQQNVISEKGLPKILEMPVLKQSGSNMF